MNEVIHCGDGTSKIVIESPKYGKQEVLIDTEDWPRLQMFKWCLENKGHGIFYSYAHIGNHRKGYSGNISMHRLIMSFPEKLVIDHVNHNGLDNRKINLREATQSQNHMNQRKGIRGTHTKHKGVIYRPKCTNNPWQAVIGCRDNFKHLGHFKTEIEAATAYNEEATKRWGGFAKLNYLN